MFNQTVYSGDIGAVFNQRLYSGDIGAVFNQRVYSGEIRAGVHSINVLWRKWGL